MFAAGECLYLQSASPFWRGLGLYWLWSNFRVDFFQFSRCALGVRFLVPIVFFLLQMVVQQYGVRMQACCYISSSPL